MFSSSSKLFEDEYLLYTCTCYNKIELYLVMLIMIQPKSTSRNVWSRKQAHLRLFPKTARKKDFAKTGPCETVRENTKPGPCAGKYSRQQTRIRNPAGMSLEICNITHSNGNSTISFKTTRDWVRKVSTS